MFRSRLFLKLFFGVLLPTFAALLCLSLLVAQQTRKELLHMTEQRLAAQTSLLAAQLDAGVDLKQSTMLQTKARSYADSLGARVTIMAIDGTVAADSEIDPQRLDNHRDRPEVLAALANGYGQSTRMSDSTQHRTMYFARRVGDIAHPLGIVRMAVSVERIHAQLMVIYRRTTLIALGGAVAAMLLGFFLVRQATLSISKLVEVAGRMRGGDYSSQAYRMRKDEIGQLGDTLNQLSNELRNKIAVIDVDKAKLQAMLAGMAEGVLAVDDADRLLFSNRAALSLLGITEPLVIDMPFVEQVRVSQLQELVARVRQTPRGHETTANEIRIYHDGKPHLLEVHANAIDLSGKLGVVLVFQDVTEVRRLESVRQEFVANASHELRTPLTVIKGYVETLLNGAQFDESARQRFLKQIAENVDNLSALINDLLNLSQLESTKSGLELRPLDGGKLAADIAKPYAVKARQKNITLTLKLPEHPVFLIANERGLQEVIGNLLDNAIKYTPETGNVTLTLSADAHAVHIEIADSGIGISAQDRERIFERFYRADKARSFEVEGTGLGLSIVKHLTQLMHGAVGVDSELHHGSRFTVTLPRAS